MTGILAACAVRSVIAASWDDIVDPGGGPSTMGNNQTMNISGTLQVDWVIDSGTLELENRIRIVVNDALPGDEIDNGGSILVTTGQTIRFRIDGASGQSGVATLTISDGTGYIIDTFTVTVT